MGEEDWGREDSRALAVFLNGEAIPHYDRDGNPIRGDSFLILVNAHHESVEYTLAAHVGEHWTLELSTDPGTDSSPRDGGSSLTACGRSVVILRKT